MSGRTSLMVAILSASAALAAGCVVESSTSPPPATCSGGCGIDKYPVEDVAPRRVQRVDALARADSDADLLTVGVVEDHLTDRRCVGCDDIGEHAPSRELQDCAAHQTVC